MENKRLIGIFITVAFLLLIPFIATQFGEADWDATDFIIAGTLLLSTGLLCEFVLRKVKKPRQRFAICALILAVLTLIWIELAVGLFGSPFAGS